ncbi:hypothetical protein DRO37_09435, partial [Candidatus Bathyarchaeota archaeon]
IEYKIARGLEKIEDIIAKRRLEALAWMLVNGTLEIKVAIPKKTFLGLGNGIFHEKLLIFRDEDECIVAASGSANETRYAYELNGENLTVHMSWREGHMEYIRRYIDKFESLWTNNHPDYYIFTLPEAIEKKLKERFYPSSPPELDPLEDPQILTSLKVPSVSMCAKLVPVARLIKELGSIKGLAHLGLGPVQLYPHQAYVVDFVMKRYPHRVLLADEVGLGKTIEAGAIIKRLVDSKKVQRVLILAPKNITRQWMEEMWLHFGLRFWLYDSSRRRFIAPDGFMIPVDKNENPFDKAGIDFIVVSSQYARGSIRREPEILSAKKTFDLIVIDEAHAARRRRYGEKLEPTRLYTLASELAISSPNLLLLTATPVQLYAGEALDLLRLLGLGGPWVHEENFEQYYESLISRVNDVPREVWYRNLELAMWIARNYYNISELVNLIRGLVDDEQLQRVLLESVNDRSRIEQAVNMILRKDPELLKRILIAFSPIPWFMIRNTRDRLKKYGYKFPERIVEEVPIELSTRHKDILRALDEYLRREYGLYERILSEHHRNVIGFVRTVYHQRFVSSFTAAYETIKNRREFLEALLRNDEEALLRMASQLLEEEELEMDEDEMIDAMKALLRNPEGRDAILRELNRVKELERMLHPYSLDILSSDDPKLMKIVEIVDDMVSRGHRVLVFSKYTDTVRAVVSFIIRHSRVLSEREIGVYTGQGGEVYDQDQGRFVNVSKEDVSKLLHKGDILVLVCSDAASEGINLQAADVVINVDLPWNPARVEQRIGRADRLGQKAEKVIVKNVWYPESIEAEMYRVLFQRKELYNLVVGPAQDIVSEGLRRAFDEGGTLQRVREIVRETIRKIEEVRERLIVREGALLGSMWDGRETKDAEIIQLVLRFVTKACEALNLNYRIDDDKLF